MDLTTLAAALFIALGLLAADTYVHSDSVELEVIAAPSLVRSERMSLDQPTLELEFEDQLHQIASTVSLVQTPLIRTGQDEGVGQAVFAAIRLKHAALALQTELGYEPDRIRLALYIEHGQLHGLISGADRRVGKFRRILVAEKDEALVDFVHRSALWSAAKLAPYTTALYLLQKHADDKDFAEVLALADDAKAQMPPTPVSLDRSLFENLLGIVALFRNDPPAARASFEVAIAADPANAPPILNAAFTDLQLGDYPKAADRMRSFVKRENPINNVLLGTAYMIWAAAEMGRRDFAAADALLAKSTSINPDCATAFDLWADAKQAAGDADAATSLHRQALADTVRFANFGELAALYFRPPWQPGQPVTRSQYANPTVVRFH
jgi:tetratricopeptide (TPR) repeat protein